MSDSTAKEELRLKLIEAEKALKAAEEDYEAFVRQLDQYKSAIQEQRDNIMSIKSRMTDYTH